jgi:hypothetical protein
MSREEIATMVVNRSVMILRAKEPFRQWLISLLGPSDANLEKINEDNTVYLIPEYEDDSQKDKLLKKYYKKIFEQQLDDWWEDQTVWPKNRNLSTFQKWFDVEFHSVVIDLVDAEWISEE